jgi:hypothetical protein
MFIAAFEQLTLKNEGMYNIIFRECFINGLKGDIQAQDLMTHPQTWLEATQLSKETQ